MVDGGTLTIADGTLTVSDGTQMSDSQHRLSNAVTSMT
jgi:hypothetical protein